MPANRRDEDTRIARDPEAEAESMRARLSQGDPTAIEERLAQLLAARRDLEEQLQRLHDTAEGTGHLDLAKLVAAHLRAA